MAVVLLLTVCLILLTFFVVPVKGAIEESDDVYELCCIRLLKFSKGNWTVSVGNYFDDYAVLTLGVGWLFCLMFADWDIRAFSEGTRRGFQNVPACRNTRLYRRKVRRR